MTIGVIKLLSREEELSPLGCAFSLRAATMAMAEVKTPAGGCPRRATAWGECDVAAASSFMIGAFPSNLTLTVMAPRELLHLVVGLGSGARFCGQEEVGGWRSWRTWCWLSRDAAACGNRPLVAGGLAALCRRSSAGSCNDAFVVEELEALDTDGQVTWVWEVEVEAEEGDRAVAGAIDQK